MILKLDPSIAGVARQMKTVFQASYAIEAELLQAIDFPPLKRTLESYMTSPTLFYGYLIQQKIVAVIEITSSPQTLHINSLVVHPDYFRQGIARQLMEYLFANFHSPIFTVETGVDNGPASQLYLKYGFKEVYQYDTDHGVRKVRFEKK